MATNQASSASTSTPNQNVMTWYAYGQALPPGMFEDSFHRMSLDQVKKTLPSLVPTTYEEANAYLQEESKKPEGERDVLREMCMVVPLNLPKDRKVYLAVPAMKVVIPIHDGAMMAIPTIELPPDSFGSPENMGFLVNNHTDLEHSMLIYDPPTNIPQKGIIVLSYMTKLWQEAPLDSSADCFRLNHSPYN